MSSIIEAAESAFDSLAEGAARAIQIGEQIVHLKGWRPDPPDHRDLVKSAPSFLEASSLPRSFLDMQQPWDTCIGIYDQRTIGACTAHGSVEIYRWVYWKLWFALPPEKRTTAPQIPEFSRLAQYAATRILEGTPLAEDSGCVIRDAIKAMVKYGLAEEKDWPYTDVETRFSVRPPAAVFRKAETHQVLAYHRVPNLPAIKREIVKWNPVIFGFTCYESLQSANTAKTGNIPIPKASEKSIGGHCMVAAGYSDIVPVGRDQRGQEAYGALLCPNSWGRGAGYANGLPGWFWLPYWYLDSGQASDFWVVDGVETPEGPSLMKK